MKTLLDIYADIEDNHIEIDDYNIGDRKAAIFHTKDFTSIVKNPTLIESATEEKSILMHELGHYHTGSYYKYDTGFAAKQRKEYRANRWAVMNYIPIDELKTAFHKGYTQAYELAEYFDVTEEFIINACDVYRRQGEII